MKITVEVEVPDGEKCIGCQFLDDRNKSYFGNSLRTADCNLFAGTFRLRGDETIYKNSDCLTARGKALDIAFEALRAKVLQTETDSVRENRAVEGER